MWLTAKLPSSLETSGVTAKLITNSWTLCCSDMPELFPCQCLSSLLLPLWSCCSLPLRWWRTLSLSAVRGYPPGSPLLTQLSWLSFHHCSVQLLGILFTMLSSRADWESRGRLPWICMTFDAILPLKSASSTRYMSSYLHLQREALCYSECCMVPDPFRCCH